MKNADCVFSKNMIKSKNMENNTKNYEVGFDAMRGRECFL